MALTVGSLFSGIGGIDLGLERAGMVTRWFCEIDPHCRNVLARHWPGLPIYGDITAVDWSGVEPVDVLAGGFPCQPISAAGRQLAQEDERWLWPEFARAVRTLRPRYVLVENVRNLLAVNGGSAFSEVLADLAACGYDAEWDCIPASAIGAPHERDRLWLLAYPNGQRQAERGERAVAPSEGVSRRSIGGGGRGDASGHEPVRGSGQGASDVADSLRVGGVGRGSAASKAIGGRSSRSAPRRSDVANANGDERSQWREQRSSHLPGEWRPSLGDTHYAGSQGHRRLSECAREQSAWSDGEALPDGRVAPSSIRRVAHGIPHRVERLRSIGNAVVPQVVEYIGRAIVAFDESRNVSAA